MHWRIFQAGFIVGCWLAAYSQAEGATGFKSLVDVVAGGAIIGVLVEAAGAVIIALLEAVGLFMGRRYKP